ncbi:HlyD family secretion protein [Bradyrhizobium genosp. P]|uniref:HlyD family secretion protein n=1 Tax=Bradyrhizobium genosp. P TaxID=83641 RepID=UPI003CF3E095
MFDNDVLEQGGPALKRIESLQSAPALQRESAPSWNEHARAPAGPADKQPESPPGSGEERKPRRRSLLRRRPVESAIGALLLASALGGGYLYVDHVTRFQSTDDAFIAARQFSIAPKVSGYLTAVPVTDNEHVKAGDVISRIDDRDYRTSLEQAQAQVAAAQASIENLDAQLDVQQSQIAANQAQVDQAQAALVFGQQQAARYQHLEQTGYGTVQNSQQYTSQLHQQQAALASAHATLKLAQRQVEALKAQRNSAVASLAQAQAQRDQAQLNLSYTVVTAAQPGRVVNLGAAVGQFAQAGTDLTMFVPDEIWVTANFKENQLDHMRPRDRVTLTIDAYPERRIRGHVDSVQPGSGTAFSLLPAQNATGNYVKIVQRVPVKIVMDDPPADVALGPGMSVVPTARVELEPVPL